jgi:hypothetical protein
MTISKWTALGIGAVILVLGYGAGRLTTPSRVLEQERIVTTDRDTELTWHAYVGRSERRVEEKTSWRTVTKWEKDGTVTQSTEAAQAKAEVVKAEVAESNASVKEKVEYRDVEKLKLVEAARPDWMVRGQVGVQVDGWRPVYGGAVERRIAGPVFAGVWGQAAGLDRAGAEVGVGVTILF